MSSGRGEGSTTASGASPCCAHPINQHAASSVERGRASSSLVGCLVDGCSCPNGRSEAAASRPRRVSNKTDAARDAVTIISLELREIGAAMGFGPAKARVFAVELAERLERAGFSLKRRPRR